MRVTNARSLAVAGLCALLAAAPSGQAASTKRFQPSISDNTQNQPPPPPTDSRDHSDLWGPAIGALIVGTGAYLATHQGHKDPPKASGPPDAQDLRDNGPHVSDIQPFGLFAAYGFVRRGWPIVIDYESDPNSNTDLNVTIGGQVWTQHLPSGRYAVMAPFEGSGADSATPALFTVVSYGRSATGPGEPSKVEVYGLGCGPQSVSPPGKPAYSAAPAARLALAGWSRDERSPFAGPPPRLIRTDFAPVAAQSTIRDLTFALDSGQAGAKNFARFDYRVTAFFSKVRTAILYYGPGGTVNGRQVIKVTSVAAFDPVPLKPVWAPTQFWNGLVQTSGKRSKGRHRLQVSGWRVEGDQSWITEFSPGDVITQ